MGTLSGGTTFSDQPEIQTFSGLRFNPFVPDPDQIVIEDIAQSLANQCRFGGHCRKFYSVAQHSCLLADLVAKEGGDVTMQLWALLHDAAEAYLVDLPHPLKHHSTLGARFRDAESALQAVILARFNLPSARPPLLNATDRALLAAEKQVLTAQAWEWPELNGVEAAAVAVQPWLPARAAREFMTRYKKLAKAC